MHLFLYAQIFIIIMSFPLIFVSIYKIKASYKEILILMQVASLLYALGTLLVMNSTELNEAIMAFRIECTGSCFIMLLILSFTSKFCRVKLPFWVIFPLFAVSFLSWLGIVAFEKFGALVYIFKSFSLERNDVFSYLVYDRAFGHIVLMCTSVLSVIITVGVIIFAFVKKRVKSAFAVTSIIIAAILPAVVKSLTVLNIFEEYNPNSLAVSLSCFIIIFTIHKYKLFDVVSSARDSVIETIDDALIVVDTNMNMLDSNPAARILFPDVISPKNKNEIKVSSSFINTLFGETEITEFTINDKYYEKHITNVFNDDNEVVGYAALILDVTTTHKYVDELISMSKNADMANSAKSDFLANMSHEIRTPMNAITGFCELCIQENDINYAHEIKKAARNMLTIINDILDISKIESGKLELVKTNYDTITMLNEIVDIAKVQLSKNSNVKLIAEIDPKLPKTLYGDDVRIKQILNNLLSNAVKFTKQGSITLNVHEISRSAGSIIVRFRVKDSGIGIMNENIPKIFKNFQQVDTKKNREIEGTGLGLSITKSLVTMMDGTITVESEYGVGSVFTVVIEQKIVDDKQISMTVNADADNGKRLAIYAPEANILVVDDNLVNLKVTKNLLAMYGIRADTAESGREAIQKIKTSYYDLVFMDHMMPDLDGVDTTKIIRAGGDAYCQQLPIIALTANAVSGAKDMFLRFGLNDFISKPIDISCLESVLEKWLPSQLYSYKELKHETHIEDYDFTHFEINNLVKSPKTPSMNDEPKDETYGISIPYVNVKAGLDFYKGNLHAYMAVLKTFYETGDKIMQRIEEHFQSRNYKDYTTEVHGLKSSALIIGATTLSEQAKKLEDAGKVHDNNTIQSETPLLLVRYGELLKNIKPYFTKSSVDDNADADKIYITDEKLKERILEVLEAFDDLEFKLASEMLNDIMNFNFSKSETAEYISETINNLDNFAYEKAEELLKRLISLI